jgi:hypothetical protein
MNSDVARRVEAARGALQRDRTIDIITTGARSGRERRTEIWFTNLDGRIIICGTPSALDASGRRRGRDWLANLKAHPAFGFHLKESVTLRLPARASIVAQPSDRRRIMSAPETAWYREQGFDLSELVAASPIVEVRFCAEYESLNRACEGP